MSTITISKLRANNAQFNIGMSILFPKILPLYFEYHFLNILIQDDTR